MRRYFTEPEEVDLIHSIRDAIDEDGVLPQKEKARALMNMVQKVNGFAQYYCDRLEEIPQNIPEVYRFLTEEPLIKLTPSIMSHIDECFHEDTALLYDYRLSDTLQDLITHQSAGEQTEENILVLRRKIEALGDDDLYRRCRLFFNAMNACDTIDALEDRMIEENIHVSLRDFIINKFYKEAPSFSGKKEFCPFCGEEWSLNHFNRSRVCNYYRQEKPEGVQPIVKQFEKNDVVYQLDKGVITFIVKPNLGEIHLFERIQKELKPNELEMYPNNDEYDLKVRIKNVCYWVDMKDFASARKLAAHLKENKFLQEKLTGENSSAKTFDQIFLVVPDHRITISGPSYMMLLENGIEDSELDIQVISERDFIDLLKKNLQKGGN